MTIVKPVNTLDALSRNGTGVAKRDQIIKLQPSHIYVKEGFNVRGVGMTQEEYWSQKHVIEHVNNIAQSYKNGDYVPPIVVKFDKDQQKAFVTDGHHRLRAIHQLIADGTPIQYVKVMECNGDESHQQILMLQSGNSLELSAVERAEIIHRLTTYGFDNQQIADRIGKSITYVIYMLKVYELPLETKRLIQQGKLTVNKALTPPSEKAKTDTRKANRKLYNKVLDNLMTVQNVKINHESNSVTLDLPLELWEQFAASIAEQKKADQLSAEEKEFLERQESLPLEDIKSDSNDNLEQALAE